MDVGNGDSIVGSSYWTMNWWLSKKYRVCVWVYVRVCVYIYIINKILFKKTKLRAGTVAQWWSTCLPSRRSSTTAPPMAVKTHWPPRDWLCFLRVKFSGVFLLNLFFLFSLPCRLLNADSCDSSHTFCHPPPHTHTHSPKAWEENPGRNVFHAGWNQLAFLPPNVSLLSTLLLILYQVLQEEDRHLGHSLPSRPGKAPGKFGNAHLRVSVDTNPECQPCTQHCMRPAWAPSAPSSSPHSLGLHSTPTDLAGRVLRPRL